MTLTTKLHTVASFDELWGFVAGLRFQQQPVTGAEREALEGAVCRLGAMTAPNRSNVQIRALRARIAALPEQG